MGTRIFPTGGIAPIDSYLVDEGGRCAGQFVRSVEGTLSTYGPTLEAEVAIAASGVLETHATAIRAIVSEESGGTLTSGIIAPLSIETYVVDEPALHVMMRFNTDSSKDTPDAWFTATGDCLAFDQALSGSEALAGGIRVKILGENLLTTFGHIRVYQE